MHCDSELSMAFLHTASTNLKASSRHRFLKTVRTNTQRLLVAREQQLLDVAEEVINLDHKIEELAKLKASIDTKLNRMKKFIGALKAKRDKLAITESPMASGRATAPCALNGCIGRMCRPKPQSPYSSPSKIAHCSVCARKECSDCGARLEDSPEDPPIHECSSTDIETAKAIASTTRRCPCCSVPIERASGCNQMFCTLCKVSFDWRSGDIVRRNIHNPHFFEWRRTQSCAEDVLSHPIFTYPNYPTPSPISDKDLAFEVTHVYDQIVSIGVMLDSLEGGRWCPPNRPNNIDLRKRLLKNSISMDTFAQCIQRRNVANSRKSEFRKVLDTTRAVCLDHLAHIQHIMREHESSGAQDDSVVCSTIRDSLQQLNAYREVANLAMSDVGAAYQADSPYLDSQWNIQVQRNRRTSAITGAKRKMEIHSAVH
jgi:hypothetical protein